VRVLILLLAAISLLAAGTTARTPAAQTSGETYEACRSGEETISASALPETVSLERCPVGDRVIRDNGIGTILPAPGQSIYVDALTTTGSQELEVTRYADGTLELEHVGDETEASQREPQLGAAARSPAACRDSHYNNLDRKVYADLKWYFNPRTVPSELSRKGAARATRRGNVNITEVQDSCGLPDRVKWRMLYQGSTRATAQLGKSGNCNGNDRDTVVSFGTLPQSTLAATCTITTLETGPNNNRVKWSDIKLNKVHFNWTTRPQARSCKNRFDVESTITHERGHTFGLAHVSESDHRNLTMSDRSNGPCQSSERSLGRGDALGLNRKY
jgi:hypothetical protein